MTKLKTKKEGEEQKKKVAIREARKTVVEKPIVKEKVTTVAGPSTVTSGPVVAPIFPFYNGSRVIEIINETEPSHKLCKMSDGTTVHVPNELFK